MGGNNKGDNNGGGNQGSKISDNDGRINYGGPWVINQFTTPGNNELQTSHSTRVPGSFISVPFYGSQIQVLGEVPPGEGNLSASYTIDEDQSQIRRVSMLLQDQPLYYQMLFVSPILDLGNHSLKIDVQETGIDRNYTFQMLKVTTPGGKDDGDKGHGRGHGENTAAIVGGVLGTIIFLLLAFLVAFYCWQRRRVVQMEKSGQQRLPPMTYYARPLSDGSQGEKALYMLEPASVIDTDSKFTFALRKDGLDEPRQSWVSVNMPPTVPDSVFVGGNRISDWSSYKGSSVIAQQSHPEVSRFSPYSSTFLTPMAFKQRTPPPVPNRRAGSNPPSQIEILTSSSLSPRPHEGRLF